MVKVIKYISIFIWILFFTACSTLNNATHKVELLKPSIYYSVSDFEGDKYPPFDHGFEVWKGYYLDEVRIKEKIDLILTNSNLFSNTQTAIEKSDFQIKFTFEWKERTFLDDFIRSCKGGYINGSLGLFPMYISETLIMKAEVFKNGSKLDSYKYNADLRRWIWVGALVNLARDDEYKLEKINDLVEKMTKAFIKDLNKEINIE